MIVQALSVIGRSMIELRAWGRVLLMVAAPLRLAGLMSHADVVALREFVARSAGKS